MGNQACCSSERPSSTNDISSINLKGPNLEKIEAIYHDSYNTSSLNNQMDEMNCEEESDDFPEDTITDDEVPNYKRINSFTKTATHSSAVQTHKLKRFQKKKPMPLSDCVLKTEYDETNKIESESESEREKIQITNEVTTLCTTVENETEFQKNSNIIKSLNEDNEEIINLERRFHINSDISKSTKTFELSIESLNKSLRDSKKIDIVSWISTDLKNFKSQHYQNINKCFDMFAKKNVDSNQFNQSKSPNELFLKNLSKFSSRSSEASDLSNSRSKPFTNHPIERLTDERNSLNKQYHQIEIRDNEILTFRTVSESEKFETKKDLTSRIEEKTISVIQTLDSCDLHRHVDHGYDSRQFESTNDQYFEFKSGSPKYSINFEEEKKIKSSQYISLQADNMKPPKNKKNKISNENSGKKKSFNSRINLLESIVKNNYLSNSPKREFVTNSSRESSEAKLKSESGIFRTSEIKLRNYSSAGHEKI